MTLLLDTNVLVYSLDPRDPLKQERARAVLEALRGVRDYRFSYYDAQAWAIAKLHQIPTLLSEDFPNDATVEGVTFLNPFGSDFDLAMLG